MIYRNQALTSGCSVVWTVVMGAWSGRCGVVWTVVMGAWSGRCCVVGSLVDAHANDEALAWVPLLPSSMGDGCSGLPLPSWLATVRSVGAVWIEGEGEGDTARLQDYNRTMSTF